MNPNSTFMQERTTGADYRYRYPFSLLLGILTVAVVFYAYGWYFEEYEKLHAAIAYGAITSPPYELWFNETLFLHIPYIAYLSGCFPAIPVYGIWHMFMMAVALSFWYWGALRILRRTPRSPWVHVVLALCLVWALTGFSWVYVNITRESILLTSISIWLLLDFFLTEGKRPFFLLALFFLGCTVRVMPGVMVLAVATVVVAVRLRSPKNVVRMLGLYWLVALVCLGSVLLFKFSSDNAGLQIEQNAEYALCDRGAVVPISQMHTGADSVRYMALMEHFLVMDSAQINLAFIHTVVDRDRYMALGINREDVDHLQESLIPLLVEYKVLLVLLYVLLAFLLFTASRRTKMEVLLLHGVGWLLVLVLAMKISMFGHFMLPWLSMLFGGSFVLLAHDRERLRRWQKMGMALTVLGLLLVIRGGLRDILHAERECNVMAYKYMADMEAYSRSTVPVVWFDQQEYLVSNILSRSEYASLKNTVYLNMYFLTYYQFVQDRCIQKLGFSPLNWPQMHRSFTEHPERVTFFMREKMADFLALYYRSLHGLDFRLVKQEPQTEVVPGVYIYVLNP